MIIRTSDNRLVDTGGCVIGLQNLQPLLAIILEPVTDWSGESLGRKNSIMLYSGNDAAAQYDSLIAAAAAGDPYYSFI